MLPLVIIIRWFGNSFSGRNQTPSDEWNGNYEYYSLWEQFEKVARVFQETERTRRWPTSVPTYDDGPYPEFTADHRSYTYRTAEKVGYRREPKIGRAHV